jgi:hypothetical protein
MDIIIIIVIIIIMETGFCVWIGLIWTRTDIDGMLL